MLGKSMSKRGRNGAWCQCSPGCCMLQSGHVVHTQLQLSVARDFDGWQLQQGLRMSEREAKRHCCLYRPFQPPLKVALMFLSIYLGMELLPDRPWGEVRSSFFASKGFSRHCRV